MVMRIMMPMFIVKGSSILLVSRKVLVVLGSRRGRSSGNRSISGSLLAVVAEVASAAVAAKWKL